MFEDEQWAHVEEEMLQHYMISTHGRVRHVERPEKMLKPTISDKGFPIVTLYGRDGRTRYLRQINLLVARAYLQPPHFDDMKHAWHIDGDLTNVHISNLRWDTRKRVLEWNEMHRRGRPSYVTPPVRNNRTGVTYTNAYECAIAEGQVETGIMWRVERQGRGTNDPNARYMYVE